MMKQPTTPELQRDIHDLKDVINAFATNTEKRFCGIEFRLDHIDKHMVTKEYFDQRLGNLREEIVRLVRREAV